MRRRMLQAARAEFTRMDPLSQGLLGACAAHAVAGHRLPRSAWLIGFVAGVVPDADIFIQPANDPLGGLLWHRHFSHALLTVPLLGGVVALAACAARSVRHVAGWTFAAAAAGVLTHGPLDAATSYGTLLYWPFSNGRVAWDVLPIIDLVVTLPMAIFLAASVWRSWRAAKHSIAALPPLRGTRLVAALGVAWVVGYAALGAMQRERVLDVQERLAVERGHTIEADRRRAMPQPLSLLLWRSVYEHRDPRTGAVTIQWDLVRIPHWPYSLAVMGGPDAAVLEGVPIEKLTRDTLLARDDVDRAADDRIGATFDRFAWFADDYTALSAERPLVVGDMRYAMGPESAPLWGLRVPTTGGAPDTTDDSLRMVHQLGDSSARAQDLWDALKGTDPRLRPVP